MADVFGFDQATALRLKRMAQNHQERAGKVTMSEVPATPPMLIGKVKTSDISAGTVASPASGLVAVQNYVSGTVTEAQDLTVYNPHDVAIPVDEYVFIADMGHDWVIIAAINYCP